MRTSILSVGIDIGTTTSQIIFSRLTLENKAAISRVPSINITDKEIIYRSKIYFTPLIDHNTIDKEALSQIIQQEYKNAGVLPQDVNVGAVIVTGESSRKQNAQEVVYALGESAGDFVVASAGADLEGIIAGRGAGAAQLSSEKKCIVANIDIGGGTSNIALFDDGIPIDTACLDIGGRQIKFDTGTLQINYIAPKTKQLCQLLGLSLKEGEIASPSEVALLCRRYVELIAETLGLKPPTKELELMVTDHLLKESHTISYIMISGGVADAVYNDMKLEDPFIYHDIGIILGTVLREYFPRPLTQARETIRATVIGAGVFTASVSGSTIHLNKEELPQKNLPVVKFSHLEEEYSQEKLIEIIKQKIQWNNDSIKNGIVLGFEFRQYFDYKKLQNFADCIIQSTLFLQQIKKIIIIVIENDFAKSLGQILSSKTNYPFIVLDSIKLQDGDFMDIGLPLYGGSVVPVVVKSLIFI
ncbi:MAG: ethanolamine ammonia-lyase reactivating factor EutA [Brevinema sp.]